jgi:hypothetical protein
VLFNGALGTPTSGTVTNLSGTASININGTVGATTPSTIAATSGTFSGSITLANGQAIRGTTTTATTGQILTLSGDNNIYIGAVDVGGNVIVRANAGSTVGTFTSTGLNSTAIGATTASTGAFTTLSATGAVVAGTTNAGPHFFLTKASPTSAIEFVDGGVSGAVKIQAVDYPVTTNRNIEIVGSTSIKMQMAGTVIGDFSSTGLAVTGALTASGNVAIGGAGQANRNINLDVTAIGANDSANLSAMAKGTGYATLTLGKQGRSAGWDINYNYPSTDALGFFNIGTGTNIAVLTSTGLGIGTTSPVTGLHVKGAYPTGFATIERTGVNGGGPGSVVTFKNDGKTAGDGVILNIAGLDSADNEQAYAQIRSKIISPTSTSEAGEMQFWTTTAGTITQKATIDSSGNLLVGTTSADPSGAGSSARVVVSTANGGQAALTAYNAGTGAVNIISIENGNGQVGRIQCSGSATSYLTSSDSRLKENVKPITDNGDIIDRLAPKKFDWKTGGKNAYGFIAQEAIEVFPEAVSAGDSGDEIKSPWAMDYSKLVPILVAELQSVRQRLAALETN